jgi:uncharacterized membrane protein YedE/YeeE
MTDRSKKYMNPYLAGFLLGLVLLLSFYLTREGLGASGAFKSLVVGVVDAITPTHTENSTFYKSYMESHSTLFSSRLVLMVIGVLIGGFISGTVMGRLKLTVEHSPKITTKKRIVLAIIGGFLFGLGAQFARGCTSGAALTGMANLSAAGYLTMIFIFGTGYIFAYFFRKNWI